jgi:hypothetical protein
LNILKNKGLRGKFKSVEYKGNNYLRIMLENGEKVEKWRKVEQISHNPYFFLNRGIKLILTWEFLHFSPLLHFFSPFSNYL